MDTVVLLLRRWNAATHRRMHPEPGDNRSALELEEQLASAEYFTAALAAYQRSTT